MADNTNPATPVATPTFTLAPPEVIVPVLPMRKMPLNVAVTLSMLFPFESLA